MRHRTHTNDWRLQHLQYLQNQTNQMWQQNSWILQHIFWQEMKQEIQNSQFTANITRSTYLPSATTTSSTSNSGFFAYPGVRDNRSTINTKTGYDESRNVLPPLRSHQWSNVSTERHDSLTRAVDNKRNSTCSDLLVLHQVFKFIWLWTYKTNSKIQTALGQFSKYRNKNDSSVRNEITNITAQKLYTMVISWARQWTDESSGDAC